MTAKLPGWAVNGNSKPAPAMPAPIPRTPAGDLDARTRAYCDAAIRDECLSVAAAPKGTRNDALNIAALKLGTLVGAGWIAEPEIVAHLEQAAVDCGLVADDGWPGVRATIRSGMSKGRTEPRTIPAPEPIDTSHADRLAASAAAKRRAEAGPSSVPEGEAGYSGSDDLPIVYASDFAPLETPTRRFLDARELIPMANVTSIYGDGATGKSLLALQLAMAVATGSPWLGRPVDHGNVLYFSAEDDEIETHIRLKEICAAEGLDLSQASGLQIALLAGQSAVLAQEDDKHATMKPTALFAALERRLASSASRLAILDNLADIFAGNENARPLARQFIGMLRGLAIKYDCAIVLLAHPSMSGINSGTGSSGNLAWGNSVRSRLYLRRVFTQDGQKIAEDDPCLRELDSKKMNYGPSGGVVRLRWEDHRFVALDEARQDHADPMARAMKAERVFMHLLDWHNDRKIDVSHNVMTRNYAPTKFARHQQCEGVSRLAFERAMENLFTAGAIEIYEYGPVSRRTKTLVRKR